MFSIFLQNLNQACSFRAKLKFVAFVLSLLDRPALIIVESSITFKEAVIRYWGEALECNENSYEKFRPPGKSAGTI